MKRRDELLTILKNEVKPSFGCSGPIEAALAACEAANAVGGDILKIKALIDKDMCTKNSDVGIPPTGIKGMRNALLIGALCGKPGKGLNVLSDADIDTVEACIQQSKDIEVDIQPDWECQTIGIYTDVIVETNKGVGRAIIAKSHSNLVYLEANGHIYFDKGHDRENVLDESEDPINNYGISELYDFAENVEISKLNFLKEAISLNCKLSEYGMSDKQLVCVFGKSLNKHSGGDFVRIAKARTAAASEARMCGESLPAMSCATSGNAGITASVALSSIAETKGLNEEDLLRALALAYLVTIKVKNRIGRHSAMCACVCGAAPGVAAGTALLLGGDAESVNRAIQNTLVNIFGVLCDGARKACELKLASAAATAMEAAILAIDGISTVPNEGILGNNADESIDFLGNFAKKGMNSVDMILCQALYEKHF